MFIFLANLCHIDLKKYRQIQINMPYKGIQKDRRRKFTSPEAQIYKPVSKPQHPCGANIPKGVPLPTFHVSKNVYLHKKYVLKNVEIPYIYMQINVQFQWNTLFYSDLYNRKSNSKQRCCKKLKYLYYWNNNGVQHCTSFYL